MNYRLSFPVWAAAVAVSVALASPAHAQSGLGAFLPPAPDGYVAGAVEMVEDLAGMEPSATRAYVPARPGVKGGFSITLTRPSPADLKSYFSNRPLGPHPVAPMMITEQVTVGATENRAGLTALFIRNDELPDGGTLEMRVGRVLVGVQGSEVTRAQILALAASMDLSALQKY